MSIPEKVFDKFFSYEARLTSFQKPQPVVKTSRAPSHARVPKTMSWPHKYLAPADLARAGFFYYPLQSNPDNVVCFLCRKAMDGWEQDDNPLVEHITHSVTCGWAVVTAIELDLDDYASRDPSSAPMMEARKATFANKWPYEHIPNWKCKTKQLAEAGWKYTPCSDSEDMATCVYCQLALDGWEPDDDPMYEHLSRSANCAYFQLLKQYGAKTKKAKSRARASKHTSRASVQSTTTVDPSMIDATAEAEDSVMTTASRKGTRKKATTTAKGRRTRAKKEETVEIQEDDDLSLAEPPALPPKPAPKKRATRGKAKADESSMMASQADISVAASTRGRGKKRTSDAMEDSAVVETEAPAPKKRATRGKAADESIAEEAAAKKPAKKGRAASAAKRKAAATRKAPATRTVSAESTASSVPSPPPRLPTADLPDDAAIDRQLLADLDRPFSDDEDLHGDSDIERQKPANLTKMKKRSLPPVEDTVVHHEVSGHYRMFNTALQDLDEDELSAELDAMEVEVEAAARKGSRVSGPKTSKTPVPAPEVPRDPEPEAVPESRPHEESIVSTGTVIRNELSETSEESSMHASVDAGLHDEGTIVKNDMSRISVDSNASGSQPVKRGRGRPPKKSRSLTSRASQPPAEASKLTEPVAAATLPAPMEVDGAEDESFESAKESVVPTSSIPGAFPGAFPEPPSNTRQQRPKSPVRRQASPAKDAPLPPLPRGASPAPSARSSVQLPRPTSPAKQKVPPAQSPFRQAVMSPFRAVQAAFSSPSRTGFMSPSKEKLVSPSKERLASPSKESLIPAPPSRGSVHSPAKSALSRVLATSPSKDSLVSSPVRDVMSPHPRGVENMPPSSAARDDPFVSSVAREPLLTSIMKEPVLTSPSRHDPLSPNDDDVIMSDGDPGTPTPVRYAPPSQPSPQYQQSPLKIPISRLAAPATPCHGPSPSASARQAVISPSQSPQSSDAENRPPSSRPASVMSKRPVLAPMPPKTPSRMSPARRNMLGAIQTTVPWSPIDLENVFGSEREVEGRASAFFDPKEGKLSTPELRMTVEEWVAHRGKRAEEFVKQECEQMVTDFEKKGMQALRAVEGLVVTEE